MVLGPGGHLFVGGLKERGMATDLKGWTSFYISHARSTIAKGMRQLPISVPIMKKKSKMWEEF